MAYLDMDKRAFAGAASRGVRPCGLGNWRAHQFNGIVGENGENAAAGTTCAVHWGQRVVQAAGPRLFEALSAVLDGAPPNVRAEARVLLREVEDEAGQFQGQG